MLRRAAVLVLALPLLAAPLLAATPAPVAPQLVPGVAGPDARRPVDIGQPPWSGVLRLLVPGVGSCTAILVAPRLALTAAHCLLVERTGQLVRPQIVHVLAGYDRERFTALALATAYVVDADWDSGRMGATRGADAALVMLGAPLGGPAQVLHLIAGWPPPGATVALPGYNQDHSEQAEADAGCHITDETARFLVHDCDGTRGTSGAPLLMRGPDGGWLVVGMQVGVRAAGRGGVAVPAVTLQALLDHAREPQ